MENTENELSLSDLWNRIWKNKILIAIIVIAATLLGTLFLFFSNRSSAKIQNDFNLHFINIDENKYADGSSFDYRDLLSLENLTIVKQSNIDFKEIDVNKMVDDIDVIIRDVKVYNNTNVLTDSYYRIEIPLNYFKNNYDLAKEFTKAITNNAISIAKEKNGSLSVFDYFDIEYDKNEGSSALDGNYTHINLSVLTYKQIINLLKEQQRTLNAEFDSFIQNYGDVRVDGLKISTLQRDFNFWYNNEVLVGQLESEVIVNKYIRNLNESVRISKLEAINLRRQKDANEAIIQELTDKYKELNTGSTVIENGNGMLKEISDRIIQNQRIDESLQYHEYIEQQTQTNINQDFEKNLIDITARMSEFTNNFNNFNVNYLNDQVSYKYHNDLEYELVKRHNMKLMIVVIVLLSGIAGCAVALIKEANHSKKELITE